MKNAIDVYEYKELKHDIEILTAKHREVLHLVLFKVFIVKSRVSNNLIN